MTERQTYKTLKLIQKGTINPKKLTLICQSLADAGLANKVITDEKVNYELTIKGKIFIWDFENWKLTS